MKQNSKSTKSSSGFDETDNESFEEYDRREDVVIFPRKSVHRRKSKRQESERHSPVSTSGSGRRTSRENLTEDLRPSAFLSEARPSAQSLAAISGLNAAQRLMFQLNNKFPDRDLRVVEDMAHEIMDYRSVDKLEGFDAAVRMITKEFIYSRALEEAKTVDEAIRNFQKGVLSSTPQKKKSSRVMKSCLRSSLDELELTIGERLAEDLAGLLAEDEQEWLVHKADSATNFSAVQQLVVDLSTLLREKAEWKASETRTSINWALTLFTTQIVKDAQEYKQVCDLLEAMRQMLEEMKMGISDEITSQVFSRSRKINYLFNQSNDKLSGEILEEITEFVKLLAVLKSKSSEKVLKKITEFEKKVNYLTK